MRILLVGHGRMGRLVGDLTPGAWRELGPEEAKSLVTSSRASARH